MLKLGTDKIGKMYLGSTEMAKAYIGSDLVYRKSSALPYDAEVEYLKSTGTQYIDTDVTPNQDIRLDFKFKNETKQNGKFLFGSGSSSTDCIRAYISEGGTWRFGGASYAVTLTGTSMRTITMDKTGVTVDGGHRSYTGTVGTFSSDVSIKIFAGATGNSAISTRIYYFQLRGDGILVRDLVPVRCGTVGYMYDRVSGRLFGNAGTGDFVLGNDITT